MTLGEFAQTCARDPKLFDLWNRLWNMSFDLVESEIEQMFKDADASVTPEDLHRGLEFDRIRKELEAECAKRSIPCPDLSMQAFARQHLQYRPKSPVVH